MSEAVTTRPIRRKGSRGRTWAVVGARGEKEVVEAAGRQVIMRRTGLAARDLRILDPLLSHPSTIVGRERAIVIKMEHVKAIITAKEVLLLNSRDPSVIPFLDLLHHRILLHHRAATAQPHLEGNSVDSNGKEAYNSEQPLEDGNVEAKRKKHGMKHLPFEFVALEACLQAVCTALENEANILEQEAHTALDNLTSEISTLNLDRVRQMKSRLVAITGRVQKARDELENLLADDEDMSEMYLTNKLVQHPLGTSSASTMNGSHESLAAGTACNAMSTKPNVEELEMLLVAYFVQIGGTLNKLFVLREYVDDTEDYINVMLDDKQNNLLQMEVKVNTINVILEAFITVTGILAINIHIELYNKQGLFPWVIAGGAACTIFLYAAAIAWYKRKRLLLQ